MCRALPESPTSAFTGRITVTTTSLPIPERECQPEEERITILTSVV